MLTFDTKLYYVDWWNSNSDGELNQKYLIICHDFGELIYSYSNLSCDMKMCLGELMEIPCDVFISCFQLISISSPQEFMKST